MRTGDNLAMTVPIERSLALEQRLADTRKTLGYQAAYFKETFSDELWEAMEHRGLTQAQFAEKAKVPKQFLTKVFRGGNCTCDTIVKLAYALNYKAHIHLTPNDVGCEWIHWIPQTMTQFQRPLTSYMEFWVGAEYKSVTNVKKEVNCATVPTEP
jgi:transcriptional regulator with XRE-family HTH domain